MTINLTEVMALAREELVETGSVTPRVHIEMEDGEDIVGFFEALPATPVSRQALLFLAGFETAGGGPERAGQMIRPRQPREAAFVAEAWMVVGESERDLVETPPSQHPDRMEVILVASMTAPPESTSRSQITVFERARDGSIRFPAATDVPQTSDSPSALMQSFWIGVAVAEQPDDPDVRAAVAIARLLAGDVRIVNLEDLR